MGIIVVLSPGTNVCYVSTLGICSFWATVWRKTALSNNQSTNTLL